MPSFSGQRDQGIRTFTSGSQRVYIHIDPSPVSSIHDYGLTELSGISFSTPEPEQILVADRKNLNRWQRVGKIYQPEELQTTDFVTTANGAGRDDWEDLRRFQIDFNMYITVGAAVDGASIQADDAHSWTQKAVVPDCNVTSVTPFGESNNSKSENAESLATGTIQYGNGVIARTVGFSDIGGSALTVDIIDGDSLNQKDYSEFFGITTNTVTTGPASQVVYVRTDKPTDGTQNELTALATDGLLDRCYVVGNALMVTRSETPDESHGYASLDDIRAGNGASAFNFVTSGYNATNGPVAAAPISEGNIILVGLGGYIYRLTNLTGAPTTIDAGVLTTQNLNDVDFYNQQVVAVGESNTVLVSNDGGVVGWSSITGPEAATGLDTVSVVAENRWFIGNDAGNLYYCEYDPVAGSATYTPVGLFGATVTAVARVDMYDRTFGWFVGNGANLLRTTSAGSRVSAKSPEFARLSTIGFSTIFGTASVDANEVFVYGDAGKLALGV